MQAWITKGLIATASGVEQERGLWFTAKGLDITVTMNVFVSQGKTSTKQKPNPNMVAATEYILQGST